MSTYIKLCKAQLHFSKIIQSGRKIGAVISDFGKFDKLLAKKALTNVAIPFAKDVLPGLTSNIALNAALNKLDKFGRRRTGKGTLRAGKVFTWFISNGDMADIIKAFTTKTKSINWWC